MRFVMVMALVAVLAGCGGNSTPTGPDSPGTTPTGPDSAGTTVPVTETFTGTTTQVGTNSCTGDSHNITAGEGEMSARLIATSDPAGALSLQICAGGVDDGNCSINQQKIAVNQVITGVRRGQGVQNLKLLPHSCVFGGPPAGMPVTYSVEVQYLKRQ